MARAATAYICQDCGTAHQKWVGKCTGCGAWNTLVEETSGATAAIPGTQRAPSKGKAVTLETLAADTADPPRVSTGIAELDRVIGGGLVPASALLIGGEPGIGKSTLLLQAAAALAKNGAVTWYFSGEEAAAQVRLRAKRLGLDQAPILLAAETNLANILATLAKGKPPDLVIVDSIQTLWSDGLDSAPGTVGQVRAATHSLIRFAKIAGSALLLVGHVTKDGQIAGPKVVEHMVDTVLTFEGDRGNPFRILRAAKNRFGPTDEIGVFEMVQQGLREVANPSELFLGDRREISPGSAVFAGIEGTRPLLVEIQALVAPSPLGMPRRAVVGWEQSRLAMVLAVLEARCGVSLSGHDVYLNVAGGLKIVEPAADLAAAAALVSALTARPLPEGSLYFGEISLSGGIRAASQTANRLKEAQRLGFARATLSAAGDADERDLALDLTRLSHLRELVMQLKATE